MDRRVTRRTVVKTAAKLAYAAPMVAASMKLSTLAAGAAYPVSSFGAEPVCGMRNGLIYVPFCGTVVDAETGLPIVGAHVDSSGDQVITDAHGRYSGCRWILSTDLDTAHAKGYQTPNWADVGDGTCTNVIRLQPFHPGDPSND